MIALSLIHILLDEGGISAWYGLQVNITIEMILGAQAHHGLKKELHGVVRCSENT